MLKKILPQRPFNNSTNKRNTHTHTRSKGYGFNRRRTFVYVMYVCMLNISSDESYLYTEFIAFLAYIVLLCITFGTLETCKAISITCKRETNCTAIEMPK